jgi:TP901 family phage tail tape measure protein
MAANVISTLYVEFAANTKKFAAAMQEVSRSVREVEKVIKPIKDRAADAGRALTIGFTAPVVAGFYAVAKAGMAFESGFASARKTITASEPEFARLRKDILDLSQVLPVASAELSEIAAVGGQFNVPVANLQKFTKTMAELSITTGISGREIAETLGQFTNITRLPKDQIDRLGSSITALGNEIGASEKKVLDFGLRIAGAGKIVGLTDAQILGFGGALASVGVEAEAGGTAISKTFIAVASAVAGGGKKLEQFGAVAGVTAKEFAAKFKVDAAGAITDFVEGLGRAAKEGKNVFAIMKDMGLNEVRLRTALLSASQAGDKLRTALALSTDEFKKNTATQKEVAERTKTTASQWILLKNQLDAVGVTFFDSFGPFLKETVIPNLKSFAKTAGDLANSFNKLSPEIKTFTFYVLAIGAVVGPALTVLTKLASTFIGLASLAYKAGISIVGFSAAVQAVSLLGAVKTYGDLQAAISLIGGTSAAATGGLIALAAAVGIAIGMFVNWLLKITGLEQGFDRLLKKTVEYVPILGKWATGANAAADAAKSAGFGVEKTVAEFAKYGVVVDKARLGDAAYIQQLRAGVTARQKAIEGTKAHTNATDAAKDAAKAFTDTEKLMNDAFGETESEATKAAKKIQQFRDDLEKATRPANFLNRELEEYRKLGATNTELARGFADEIVKAAEAQQLHGFVVKGVVAELLNEATAFTKVEEAAKFLKKFQEDMKNAPPLKMVEFDIPDTLREDLKSKTLAGLNDSKTAVYQLNDALAQMKYLAPEDAVRLFGDQLKAAAVYARTYGENALSPTTQKLIEFMERTEDAKDAQDAWNTASNKGTEALYNMRENVRTSR